MFWDRKRRISESIGKVIGIWGGRNWWSMLEKGQPQGINTLILWTVSRGLRWPQETCTFCLLRAFVRCAMMYTVKSTGALLFISMSASKCHRTIHLLCVTMLRCMCVCGCGYVCMCVCIYVCMYVWARVCRLENYLEDSASTMWMLEMGLRWSGLAVNVLLTKPSPEFF